jgi:hypothetical protein
LYSKPPHLKIGVSYAVFPKKAPGYLLAIYKPLHLEQPTHHEHLAHQKCLAYQLVNCGVFTIATNSFTHTVQNILIAQNKCRASILG